MTRALSLLTISFLLVGCRGGVEGGDPLSTTGAGTGVLGTGPAGTGVVGMLP